MFTQCPKCETIFKLSAEVLRAAAGEVRCGRCGEIFNALSSLAEEPRAFTKGESAREQEARADNILHFVPADPPPTHEDPEEVDFSGRPGTQYAHLQFQDAPGEELPWSLDEETDTREADTEDDASLEFTLPPGELDRIFIEARPRAVPRPPASARIDVDEIEPAPPADIRNDLSDSLIESVTKRLATETPAWAMASTPAPASTPATAPASTPAPAPAPSPHARFDSDDLADAGTLADSGGAAVAEPVARIAPHPESIAVITPEPQWIVDEPPAAKPRRALWIAAAVALLLLLLGQIVHQNRESLAQSAGIGPALRSLYSAIGRPIPVQINLAAFEVRQWGVTGDASANGTLRVRASVINTSEQPQPYPLLRLTLADRFGTHIGSRDFLPKEYLRRDPARPLDPRERADAVVEIVDPGKTAEGFEIDVCAPLSDGRIACANDVAIRARS